MQKELCFALYTISWVELPDFRQHEVHINDSMSKKQSLMVLAWTASHANWFNLLSR